MRDKLFKEKESMSILTNNKQEHLGMRQQGGIFTGITGTVSNTMVSTGFDSVELGR